MTSGHSGLQMVRLEKTVRTRLVSVTLTHDVSWQGKAQCMQDLGFKHKQARTSKAGSVAIRRCPFGVRNNTHTQTVLSVCVSVGFSVVTPSSLSSFSELRGLVLKNVRHMAMAFCLADGATDA